MPLHLLVPLLIIFPHIIAWMTDHYSGLGAMQKLLKNNLSWQEKKNVSQCKCLTLLFPYFSKSSHYKNLYNLANKIFHCLLDCVLFFSSYQIKYILSHLYLREYDRYSMHIYRPSISKNPIILGLKQESWPIN